MCWKIKRFKLEWEACYFPNPRSVLLVIASISNRSADQKKILYNELKSQNNGALYATKMPPSYLNDWYSIVYTDAACNISYFILYFWFIQLDIYMQWCWLMAIMLLHLQKKYSYLDVIGRTVVVLEKKNVVPEHNVPFQVTSQALLPFIYGRLVYPSQCPVLLARIKSSSKTKNQWYIIMSLFNHIHTHASNLKHSKLSPSIEP